MPDLHEFWDPNEWELHVFGLLQDRHGVLNVMKVPARHKGDYGLDYYCLSHRVAYQCYAVQEPCEVADRANKQKAKITTDLKKFCTKKSDLEALFGKVQINRWVLVVPIHDSGQVNLHLTSKAAEVRSLGLPYVGHDFEVLVHDIESFDAGSREYRASQRQSISLPSQPPTQQEITDWAQMSNPLVTTLSQKLSKRVETTAHLEKMVHEAIGWFLERENVLETLRLNAPQLHEELVGVISRHTDRLRLYGPPPNGTPHHILRAEVEELAKGIQQSVPNFTAASAQQVALGTVVEWLLRCPLDFPPYDHAA